MNDELGNRMKSNYEDVTRYYLSRRTPVIIRLDGKAFHTFTKGFDKPFDSILVEAMQYTTEQLCKNVQGCVFGYCQSDEISLLLVDYKKLNSDAWFGYNIQKCSSIVSSLATNYFNSYLLDCITNFKSFEQAEEANFLSNKLFKASFDARIFNIPKEEVVNYFIWRQNDCIRNAINSIGQYYFSHKDLQYKNVSQIKEMLVNNGINEEDYSGFCRFGSAIIKDCKVNGKEEWLVVVSPIFKENRNFINKTFIFN